MTQTKGRRLTQRTQPALVPRGKTSWPPLERRHLVLCKVAALSLMLVSISKSLRWKREKEENKRSKKYRGRGKFTSVQRVQHPPIENLPAQSTPSQHPFEMATCPPAIRPCQPQQLLLQHTLFFLAAFLFLICYASTLYDRLFFCQQGGESGTTSDPVTLCTTIIQTMQMATNTLLLRERDMPLSIQSFSGCVHTWELKHLETKTRGHCRMV